MSDTDSEELSGREKPAHEGAAVLMNTGHIKRALNMCRVYEDIELTVSNCPHGTLHVDMVLGSTSKVLRYKELRCSGVKNQVRIPYFFYPRYATSIKDEKGKELIRIEEMPDGGVFENDSITVKVKRIPRRFLRNVTLRISAKNISKSGFLTKSRARFVFGRIDGEMRVNLYRSEVSQGRTKFHWNEFDAVMDSGATQYYVELYDCKRDDGSDSLIGELVVEGRQLAAISDVRVEQIEERISEDSKATITISATLKKSLRVGCVASRPDFRIRPLVLVDFSAANGAPGAEGSLHGKSKNWTNEYLEVMREVFHALGPHVGNPGGFSVLGTGVNPGEFFPLNDDPKDPMISDFSAFEKHYESILKRISLGAFTDFVKALEIFEEFAADSGEGETSLLLLLTPSELSPKDGVRDKLREIAARDSTAVVIFSTRRNEENPNYWASWREKPEERSMIITVPRRSMQIVDVLGVSPQVCLGINGLVSALEEAELLK